MKNPILFLAALLPLIALAGPVPPAGRMPGEGTRAAVGTTRYSGPVVLLDVAGGPGLRLNPSSALTGALSGWLMWHSTRQPLQPEGAVEPFPSRFAFGGGLRLTHLRSSGSDRFEGRAAAEGMALEVNDPQLTALNLAMHLRLRVLGKPERHPLSVGFNIDLGGFSFGPARTALQVPLSVPPTFNYATRPVRANVLLGNKNDRGTLNSELYLAWKATPRLALRGGWAHVASGYAHAGARYQRFTNLMIVGLSYDVKGG